MSLPLDPAEELQKYAHPERLVTAEWLQGRLGSDDFVLLESNEDVLLYETGHIVGAHKIDWHTDLNDPVMRDFIDGVAFAALASKLGITPDTTVIIYGDRNNWWAAYALWVFTLFGHRDVRLLDGGRDYWVASGRELTRERPAAPAPSGYPIIARDDETVRAFSADVLAHGDLPLIDVRSVPEFVGDVTVMEGYPLEGTMKGGHVPGARNVPWATAAREDARFRPREELDVIYQERLGLEADSDVIVYCRIGERSAHTWFVLTHLLGIDRVRNYDGSWAEWGNLVRMPIALGPEASGR